MDSASTVIAPRRSVTHEAAEAIRAVLELWPKYVRPVPSATLQAEWQTLRNKLTPALADRADAEIYSFSTRIRTLDNSDTAWYEEAQRRVDMSGKKLPRRSSVQMFALGKVQIQALLDLQEALARLKTCLLN